MQQDSKHLQAVAQQLARYFDDEAPAAAAATPDYQRLFTRLKLRIAYLLEHNNERLWQALYRIDVPEQQVKEAFTAGSVDEIAEALATHVLNREVQKAEMRARYKS